MLSVPITTGPTEWDTISLNDEPMSIADIIEEEIDSSDDSITSEESTNPSEERSERSAAENDLDTDACDEGSNTSEESSNSIEESDDAAENVSIENPFEDEEIQNFQAVEIRDIHAMLDAISKELGDGEDNEFLEMQAMLVDSMEEELEESDSGYDVDQAVNIDESDVIQEVIIGLGPQKTAQQKIHEWFEKMV